MVMVGLVSGGAGVWVEWIGKKEEKKERKKEKRKKGKKPTGWFDSTTEFE